MTRFSTAALVAASLALAAAANTADAQFTFTEVARTGDPVPGGGATYDRFGSVAIDGDSIAFQARLDTSTDIILAALDGGPLQVVALDTDLRPGTSNAFDSFDADVAVSGTNVVFASNNPIDGHYFFDGTGVSTIAEGGAPAPGGTYSSLSGDVNRLDGHNYAVEGSRVGLGDTVFAFDGTTTRVVADESMTAPGFPTQNFTDFDEPSIGTDGTVAFEGQFRNPTDPTSFEEGVYTELGGAITEIVSTFDAVPDAAASVAFEGFDGIWIDGDDVVFRASTTNEEDNGIYASLGGGPVIKLVDRGDAVPGGTGTFESFLDDSITFIDGLLAFEGRDEAGRASIFFQDIAGGGDLTRIIGDGDTLDGEVIDLIDLHKNGFDGLNLAFDLRFENNERAIYTTVIPEPTSLALLAVGGLLVARRRRG